jgi:hypothetical protein
MGVEHLTHAAEACGFAVAQLDMATLPFAQQLQVRSAVHLAPPCGLDAEVEHLASLKSCCIFQRQLLT